MGRNEVEKGSRDNWTFKPKDVAAVQADVEKERGAAAGTAIPAAPGGQRGGGAAMKYFDALRDPAKRDPRGFIIPLDQPISRPRSSSPTP
jgi:hypothetical protein